MIYYIKNISSIIYYKILLIFGFKLKKDVIPQGEYCYIPDYEKNKNREPGVFYIKTCKYYKVISPNYNGCSYLGIITNDYIFDDRCKICGENIDEI